MNPPVVNFLKRSEQRYQGAISLPLFAALSTAIPLAFVVLVFLAEAGHCQAIKHKITKTNNALTKLKPQFKAFQQQQNLLKRQEAGFDLVDVWINKQLSAEELLKELKSTVPENIQLTSVSLAGKMEKKLFKNAKDTIPSYRFTIQGVSEGKQPEGSVIELRKNLISLPLTSQQFPSIKLETMRKKMGEKGSIREFKIVGISKEGERP